jgi:hypothetical protein
LTNLSNNDNIFKDIKCIGYNKDGHLIHYWATDSLYHVMSYDAQGRHCSEPNCEINFEKELKN